MLVCQAGVDVVRSGGIGAVGMPRQTALMPPAPAQPDPQGWVCFATLDGCEIADPWLATAPGAAVRTAQS